jgi:hypothetical protein
MSHLTEPTIEGAPGRYWHVLEDGRVQCDVCPRFCKLHEGQRGLCFVRARRDDRIVLTTYGRSSGFCIDPIEKKPLNHFLPGTPVLSFGTAGCNLTCKFCQNWDISKARQLDIKACVAVCDAGGQLIAFQRLDGAFWASGIAAVLRTGGRFVLVDFHPVADMFDERWNHAHAYPSGGEPRLLREGVGDYVGESGGGLTPEGFVEGERGFENPQGCHLFRWGLGEVVTALAGAGLRIVALEEYPYSNGERLFDRMREVPGRRMVPPESVPAVPLMYGISAEKI